METKHLDRTDQRVQALRHQRRAVVRGEGRLDDPQVGQKVLGQGVGVLRCHGMAGGVTTGQVFQGGGQAGVDACERTAVGLVHTVFTRVG